MRQRRLHYIQAGGFVGLFRIGPRSRLLERVHIDGRVQRGAPEFIRDVRIRAMLQQINREIVMRVDDRHHQRTGSVGIGQVQVRARLHQHLCRFERILPRGIEQRR